MLPKQLCLVLSVFFFPDEAGRVTRSTFAKMPPYVCMYLSHLVTLFGGLARFQFGRDACQINEASFFADVLCSLHLQVQIFCCMKSRGFSWIGHNHSAVCTWMATATALDCIPTCLCCSSTAAIVLHSMISFRCHVVFANLFALLRRR